MESLERYVADCEGKRRRTRDRPSDAVVTELRSLLDFFRAVRDRRPSAVRDVSDFPVDPERQRGAPPPDPTPL